ncbi:MAG: hypothetical protein MSA90_04585 [Faecalicatena sp.]|uniref:hypothetical protein n=1 Tax=Faecalicatena sp. TaxID=2005360 RepID=UPI002590E4C6|nr:hypothetical protein [Faecalicatena sp.]MCI6464727.1 hypothetical protein [Faecalicatena sp.]MDY5618305.1 hypothetical protein [Lachnospiraceae bacterium]
MELSISDIIQIIGILASLLTSLIAIIISVITLRQNSKMIEESLRPNIQIYPVYINSIVYIIVKNFGSSQAYIDEISCSHKFTKKEIFGDDLGTDIFERLNGALFSPGYSIKCPLVGYAVTDDLFKFDIKYHTNKKRYSDTFLFNLTINAPFADVYPSSNNTEQCLKNIAKELHDIVKINL